MGTQNFHKANPNPSVLNWPPKVRKLLLTLCFFCVCVYELLNCYELPIRLQASKLSLKSCTFCIIQKIKIMQMENTSLLQFSPKMSYKYWAQSPVQNAAGCHSSSSFRDGTGRCARRQEYLSLPPRGSNSRKQRSQEGVLLLSAATVMLANFLECYCLSILWLLSPSLRTSVETDKHLC